MHKMQYTCVACSVRCSICSMKWTDADAGAGAGSFAVFSVQRAVLSVQCPARFIVMLLVSILCVLFVYIYIF